MRFAYADPPYLGQGKRYAHLHPEAYIWDDPATHAAMVERLEDEFPDGWAVSLCPQPEAIMAYMKPGLDLAVWHRPGWQSGSRGMRLSYNYELVVYRTAVPNSKLHGPMVSNVFTLGGHNWQTGSTHTGTKPPEFCSWVLDLLGYDPDRDEIDDLFPGDGAMTRAAAQHRLRLWDPNTAARRRGTGGRELTRLPSRAQEGLPLNEEMAPTVRPGPSQSGSARGTSSRRNPDPTDPPPAPLVVDPKLITYLIQAGTKVPPPYPDPQHIDGGESDG